MTKSFILFDSDSLKDFHKRIFFSMLLFLFVYFVAIYRITQIMIIIPVDKNVNISGHLDLEHIKYSLDDCGRSLPNVFDGLKESQRKILYSIFEKNFIKARSINIDYTPIIQYLKNNLFCFELSILKFNI